MGPYTPGKGPYIQREDIEFSSMVFINVKQNA